MHPERVERVGRRRRALACSLAVGAAFASRTASAGDLVDLRWSSPPGCPQIGAVEEQIRAIVSNSARVTPGLRADGEITRIASRYRLTLVVYDANGRRERIIESDSCTALAGAAAVALGLLLRGERSGANSTGPVAGDAGSTSPENTPQRELQRELQCECECECEWFDRGEFASRKRPRLRATQPRRRRANPRRSRNSRPRENGAWSFEHHSARSTRVHFRTPRSASEAGSGCATDRGTSGRRSGSSRPKR